MAKKSDHLAGFDDENTGGLLSGFLADEDTFDRPALWRIGSWGAGATAAVMLPAHFTLDNLSLMALTIAVGFVVDDAIVMVEAIWRRI